MLIDQDILLSRIKGGNIYRVFFFMHLNSAGAG